MARTSKTQSNAQESEAQRTDSQTSSDGTAARTQSAPTTRLTADEQAAMAEKSVNEMLGKDDEKAPKGTTGEFKTVGQFLIHDPTTGDTVTPEGAEVRISAFIKKAEEDGRIVKA